jgi:hypothetical protein
MEKFHLIRDKIHNHPKKRGDRQWKKPITKVPPQRMLDDQRTQHSSPNHQSNLVRKGNNTVPKKPDVLADWSTKNSMSKSVQ